jgi:drug/metabolite transporter (DMT)-like permease
MLVGATVCYFFALRFIPLADAAAIIFVAPLMVTALSGLMLGEQVGVRRWAAVLAGFAGMLLIVRPGLGTTHWGAGFALAAAVGFSFYFLLTRKVSGRTPPLVTLWFMGVVGTLVMSPLAVPVWQAPDLDGWFLMAGIGGVMALGHLFIITAMDFVEASAIAPLIYLEMVTATALGYFWFGDFPDALTWAGCAVVICAGLFVAYRERILAQRAAEANLKVR